LNVLFFQIHSEIDELHHHLQARRGSYGNSLPAAKMTSQAFKQFEMTVEVCIIVHFMIYILESSMAVTDDEKNNGIFNFY
jgi:hypothetical protein